MLDPESNKRLALSLSFEGVDELPRPIYDPKDKLMEDETWTLIGQDLLERFLDSDGKSLAKERMNGDLGMLFRNLEPLPFYLYKGTLTHPDCEEARWIVMREPLKAKKETIEAFAAFVADKKDFQLGNARELQPLIDPKKVKISASSPPKDDPIYKKRDWEKFAEM